MGVIEGREVNKGEARKRRWTWRPNLRVTTATFEADVRALTTDVGVVDLATVVRVATLTAVVSGQRL